MNFVYSCGHFVDGEFKVPIGASGRPIPVYVFEARPCDLCAVAAALTRDNIPSRVLPDAGSAAGDMRTDGDGAMGTAGLPQLCCGCVDASGGSLVPSPLRRRGSVVGLPPSEVDLPLTDVVLALHDFIPPGNVCLENPTPLLLDDGCVVDLPPVVAPIEVEAEVIGALPVVPAAPALDEEAALASMQAAHAAHLLRTAKPEKDENKTDPEKYVCPMVFKARHIVPWYRRWFNKCCGCVLSKVPSTRRYNLVNVEDVDLEDNRLTAGLSHTLLRQDPRLAVYSIVNYDQYDEEMELIDVDPVTFEKSGRVGQRCIRVPVIVLQDLMAKHATNSVTPSMLSQVYDSLIRVVNVPFNKDLELKINFTMFCQDYLAWLGHYRSALGLQNFQQPLLT